MPLRLGDTQVRDFHARQQGKTLDDQAVVDLLAAVADGDGANAAGLAALQQQLSGPGLSRAEQFELAKAGLSPQEKEDLGKLLDAATVPMAPMARNFLEALVGRAALTAGGPLQLDGDWSRGLAGTAKAGDVIEAINLSTAAAGRLHLTDTMEVARADASGRFAGVLPGVREGDVVRLRTRSADGKTVGDWFTVAARGVGEADEHNATVNLERLDLAVAADGKVSLTHNTSRPVSEPGALLRFTNMRTGKETDVSVTDQGSIPGGLQLDGKAGDTFVVSVSDRVNNADFFELDGTLTVASADEAAARAGVDLADPLPTASDRNSDGTAKHQLKRFSGPLFRDRPQATDVRQGAIGDCYFAAGMAAVAASHPEALERMVKKNDDGSFTVRFLEVRGSVNPVDVKVDADLYVRSSGSPLYGGALGEAGPAKMELWFSLVEKAYAQWKGDYETIGEGGHPGDVMSHVLGARPNTTWVTPARADAVWQVLEQAQQNRAAITAATWNNDGSSRYTNTRLYADHAYSVLGLETENGQRYVKLRNPWGESEPGFDGANDGVFRLTLEDFTKFYNSVQTVVPPAQVP